MKFLTLYSEREPRFSNSGVSEKVLYGSQFDSGGVMMLVEKGKVNLYEEIQSHKDGVDIYVLLSRYQNGDSSALSKVQGVYGDFSNVPVSFADMLNIINDGRTSFDALPVEVKARFNHSFEEFLVASNSPDFAQRLGVSDPINELPEEFPEPTPKGEKIDE